MGENPKLAHIPRYAAGGSVYLLAVWRGDGGRALYPAAGVVFGRYFVHYRHGGFEIADGPRSIEWKLLSCCNRADGLTTAFGSRANPAQGGDTEGHVGRVMLLI